MSDNLLDKASILLTPTAYNDGSMLSVKPENGDGDFTFSRGSAATRVNAQGLVENVQIISSELVSNGNFSQEGSELVVNGDFATDSNWIKQNGWSIASGSANCNDSTGYRSISQSSLVNTVGKTYKVTYEVSNYVSGEVRCILGGFALGQVTSSNGIVTETITTSNASSNTFVYLETRGSGFIGSIDNVSVKEVGQDWTISSGATINNIGLNIDYNLGNGSTIQTNVFTIGKTYKVQVNVDDNSTGVARIGLGLSPVTLTNGLNTFYLESVGTGIEIRNHVDFIGSISNISVKEITDDTDLPRIDYTDGCGSWLLEPQSTNLIAQSEALSTIVSQSTITDNNLASPTGDVNASLVVENTATNSHGIKKSNIIPTNENAVDYTISVFAKKKERQFVQLQLYADSTQYNSSIFNLNDGTTTGNSSTHKIEDYGNGWYRCSFTDSVTQSTGGFNFAAAYMSQSLTSYYTGDGASGIYMFGFQFEQQSYATSYILTNGAIATRLADVATNSGNSTLINSTEGVLYAEIAYLNDTGTYRTISINDGSNNNMVAFENRPTSNQIKAFVNVLGVNVMNSTQTLSNVKEFNKVAIKWKQNDFAWWVNGVKIYEDLSGSTFGSGVLNKVNFNNGAINFPFEGKVKALAVYKEALTDAQLQSLTTT